MRLIYRAARRSAPGGGCARASPSGGSTTSSRRRPSAGRPSSSAPIPTSRRPGRWWRSSSSRRTRPRSRRPWRSWTTGSLDFPDRYPRRVASVESQTSLADLNPAQREAVLHTDGPLLVIAGAGSGKTRVLTHRVAHLIAEEKADPSEILAITFTNRAATEMKERVEQLVGGRVSRQMWVMTFHSACGRMLRRDAELIGYRSSFTIYDQADQVRLVKNCIEDLGKDPKRFVPRAVHGAISRAKDRLVTAGEYADQIGSFFEQSVAEVYDLYERRMHDANAMDFDDLIMKTVLLLEHVPEARRHWQKAFRYVMVDEYQDTNHAQFKLVSILAEKHTNLAVVGDQDQSIYAFRGADIRNIAEFEQDFPNARVIALEQNYRSTQTILDAANSVISHNRDRKPKNLWSDLGAGDVVRVVEAEDEHAE